MGETLGGVRKKAIGKQKDVRKFMTKMREEEKKFRGKARECEEGSGKLGANGNFVTEFQELLFPPL